MHGGMKKFAEGVKYFMEVWTNSHRALDHSRRYEKIH